MYQLFIIILNFIYQMNNRSSDIQFKQSEQLLVRRDDMNPQSLITEQDKDLQGVDESHQSIPKPAPTKERLMSLDAYRGLTVFGMILADQTYQIDGAFWLLIHPHWNGLTFADLVFPSFLFIMGVAIPLAVSKSRPIQPKNIIRVFALFAIGLILNIIESFNFPQLRILGILQRLSLCYGINLFVHWITDYGTNVKKRAVAGCIMFGTVILYIVLMLTWYDDSIGCPKEHNLEPYCNFAGFVDRAVFTQNHILELTDPEGLIPTITASFTTYIGYLFGLMVLRLKNTPHRLVKYWLIFAVICTIFIYPCSLLMPFNKRLYTITFVFTNLASCATVLSLFMVVADILPKLYPSIKQKVITFTQPLNWLGLNPLAVFILLQLTMDLTNGWITWGDDQTPYTVLYDAVFSWMGAYIGTLVYSLFYGIVLTLAGGLLFRYKIFLRL